jgi:hypothetical protein
VLLRISGMPVTACQVQRSEDDYGGHLFDLEGEATAPTSAPHDGGSRRRYILQKINRSIWFGVDN